MNKRSGQEADVTGLRPYRRGDSLRQVHWPQTARQSTMIVRDRPGVSQPRVWIVIDLDPAVHWGAGDAASQEEVFRAARTLVTHFHRARTQLEVQVGWGDGPFWNNRLGLRPILDGFARWTARHSDSLPASPRSGPAGADRLLLITTSRRGELPKHLPPSLERIVVAESASERSRFSPAAAASTSESARPLSSFLSLEPAGPLEFAYESFAV